MAKPNIAHFFKSVQVGMSKHSPEILTGIGIAGMIATTVVAVKATPKAIRLIEQAQLEKGRELGTDEESLEPIKLTPMETVKTCWKCYIPAVVTGVSSVACLVGASAVNARRNAALAAAYTLSDTALREYREKVVETVGEKKEHAVRDAIAKDKVAKNPAPQNGVVLPGEGATICYDAWSGRHFNTTHDKLKNAENEINSQMLDEGSASLNDFYYCIGLEGTKVGEEIGWNYNRDKFVRLSLSAQLDNGVPCVVLDFQTAPYYGYDKYY
jgi:hypothetical protein